MNKTTALTKALAVFYYCLSKLPKAIVCLTSINAMYNVNIILYHEDYDSAIEQEKMENAIMAGSRIMNYEREWRNYDAIDVTYYYKEDTND